MAPDDLRACAAALERMLDWSKLGIAAYAVKYDVPDPSTQAEKDGNLDRARAALARPGVPAASKETT